MNQTTADGELLYSSLGGDEDLSDIVEMFVDEMPERTAEFTRCANAADWEGLGRLAHQLKGAAGSYGFSQLTPFAAHLEAACRCDSPDEAEIRPALERLLDCCNRVRAGTSE